MAKKTFKGPRPIRGGGPADLCLCLVPLIAARWQAGSAKFRFLLEKVERKGGACTTENEKIFERSGINTILTDKPL